MNTELNRLMLQAEDRFLEDAELQQWQDQIDALATRLDTYESLRELETSLFESIVQHLFEATPHQSGDTLRPVIMQWISIYRYASMAMLLGDPDFLKYRLLEWLGPVMQVHRTPQSTPDPAIFYQLMQKELKSLIRSQYSELEPYLQLAVDFLMVPSTELSSAR